MPNLRGTLTEAIRLQGWAQGFRIRVNGKDFYRNSINDENFADLERARQSLGKEVVITYHNRKESLWDKLLDRVSGASYGVPRRYDEVNDIMSPEEALAQDEDIFA